MEKTPRRCDAFTLLEVVVVLVVIAVLSAILFPAFVSACNKSAASICLSNERHLGNAVLQYTADNDWTFPLWERNAGAREVEAAVGVTGEGPLIPWHWVISEYLPCKDQNISYYAGDFEFDGGVWSCPSFPVLQEDNYGLNTQIGGDQSWFAVQNAYGFKYNSASVSNIPSPSKSILIAEKGYMGGDDPSYTEAGLQGEEFIYTPDATDVQAANALDGKASMSDPYPWPPNVPSFRHANKCNVCFADGHVGAVKVDVMSGMKNWCSSIYVPNPGFPSWYPYNDSTGKVCSDFAK